MPAEGSDQAKTVFVYRDSDVASLEDLTKVIADNWKYKSVELISIDELANYETEVNDFLFLIDYGHASVSTIRSDGSMGPGGNYVDFFLRLNQKTETGYTSLASAVMSVSGPTIFDVSYNLKTSEVIVQNQYKSHTVFSWNYAYLGTVLKTISDKFDQGVNYNSYGQPSKNLKALTQKTLYISDAIESRQSTITGAERIVKSQEAVDKVYDYSFEIVTNERINEIVASEGEGYVFMFQKVGKGKVSIVLDLSNNEIIYINYVGGKYQFENKDIMMLNKAIAA